MGWNLLEKDVDTRCMVLMSQMVIRLYDGKEKRELTAAYKERGLLAGEDCAETMEEAYGLHYPGEVLERYKEKIGDSIRITRALAMALAQTKPFFLPGMFVGGQYSGFLKEIRTLAEKDLYLEGACYALEESADRMLRLQEEIQKKQVKNAAQAVYFLSLLPETSWEYQAGILAAKLSGSDKPAVFGNEGLYEWIAVHLSHYAKKLRKKEYNVLKAVCRLPDINIYAQNPVKKWLLKAGYTEDEAVYLNAFLAVISKRTGRDSVMAERIALETCSRFLGGVKEFPREIYGLCGDMLSKYRKFPIQINGNRGIVSALSQRIQPGNVHAFQLLYPYAGEYGLDRDWIMVNLRDTKWNRLLEVLDTETYPAFVCENLCRRPYTAADISGVLAHYKALTGKNLTERFWYGGGYAKELLEKLVSVKLFDLTGMVRRYFADYNVMEKDDLKRKWRHMMTNLKDAAFSLKNRESFEVFQMTDAAYGIEEIDKVFGQNVMETAFGVRYNTYSGVREMHIYHDTFSDGENRLFFEWVQRYVFHNWPDQFDKFAEKVLLSDKAEDLMGEDARKAALLLLDAEGTEEWKKKCLRERYLTAEEYLSYQKEQEKLEAKRREEEEEQQRRKLEEAFAQLTPGIKAFSNFFSFRYGKERELAGGLIRDYFRKCCGQGSLPVSEEEVPELLGILERLAREKWMPVGELKDIIAKMEVTV